LQINISVAIDYTASNGEITQPTSLHFLGPQNQYEKAIQSVGSILEVYDHDRSFPVFGFGGIPRFLGATRVAHSFPLNGLPTSPDVHGTTNMLELYKKTLPSISLSGPTYFAPLI
jgi:copine 5/8/9